MSDDPDNYVQTTVCLPCDDGDHEVCYGGELCRCACHDFEEEA